MLKLHNIIFRNSKAFAGQFRKKGTEVGIRDGTGNIIHLGAPSHRVTGLLTELVKWYNNNKNKLPPIVLAAVIHNQFEYIHPFEDGNGRVGRLLLNNILIKNHMPPVNISMESRKEYYETLRLFQRTGDIKPTIDLILKEYHELEKKLKINRKNNRKDSNKKENTKRRNKNANKTRKNSKSKKKSRKQCATLH